VPRPIHVRLARVRNHLLYIQQKMIT
jgi:hypothetical protein